MTGMVVDQPRHRSAGPDRDPTSVAELTDAGVAFAHRAGADCSLRETDGRRAVAANHRWPAEPPDPEALYRSPAAPGSLVARVNRRVAVVADWSVAVTRGLRVEICPAAATRTLSVPLTPSGLQRPARDRAVGRESIQSGGEDLSAESGRGVGW